VIAIDQSTAEWRSKPDQSPVSVADDAANAAIMAGLSQLFPGAAIVSEEAGCGQRRYPPRGSYVLVDPLDGTREYLAGRDEYTVNIAVVAEGRPRVGLIAAPAFGLIWRGVVGRGTERLSLVAGAELQQASQIQVVQTRRQPASGLVAMASRSHYDTRTAAFLHRLPVAARLSCGSSLKFCRIAEGAADVYARFAQTCEWDVAAGHAILAAAGGVVTTPEGKALLYGRADDFHIPGFIAWGDPVAAWSLA
jgi:3'(2'), 5'-bisphosphate nucleotidase